MLKRFFDYYRPHRGLFLLDFGCAVLSGLLELGFPIAVQLAKRTDAARINAFC